MTTLQYPAEHLQYADTLGAIYLRDNHIESFDQMTARQRNAFRDLVLCKQRDFYRTADAFEQIHSRHDELLRHEHEVQHLSIRSRYISFAGIMIRGDGWLNKTAGESFDADLKALGIGFDDEQALVTWANALINELTPEESQLVRQRFGLESGQPQHLDDVAQYFNITRERARQLEAKAYRKLRYRLARARRAAELHVDLDKNLHEAVATDPIEILGFTIRTYNSLCRAEINDVGHLVEMVNSGEIYHVRNIGRNDIKEITRILAKTSFASQISLPPPPADMPRFS